MEEHCIKILCFSLEELVISALYNTEGFFSHLGHKVKAALENGHTVDASVKRGEMIR